MKNILLINGSPRSAGTSAVLLEQCRMYLAEKGFEPQVMNLYPALKKPDQLYAAVAAADTVVFSGPSYINTYPADATAFLSGLQQRPALLHGQRIYGIIQGGMPYAHTHQCGLSMLEVFCRKCDLAYGGGFVMGMGAYLNGKPINDLPNGKKVMRQLDIFFEHIAKNTFSPPSVYEKAQLRLPAFVWRFMAMRMNCLIDRDLLRHGIDIHQESPYLTENL